MLFAFGWAYPHFLTADRWIEYAYAAPLGIVPCATLSGLIGLTLVFGLFRARAWATALAAAGVVYGMIGVFRLGVLLDFGLLAGAAVLAMAARPSVRHRLGRAANCDARSSSSRRAPLQRGSMLSGRGRASSRDAETVEHAAALRPRR